MGGWLGSLAPDKGLEAALAGLPASLSSLRATLKGWDENDLQRLWHRLRQHAAPDGGSVSWMEYLAAFASEREVRPVAVPGTLPSPHPLLAAPGSHRAYVWLCTLFGPRVRAWRESSRGGVVARGGGVPGF
jgi:hypothetical protein